MAMMSTDDMSALARTRLFRNLDRSVLESLAGPGMLRVFDKGRTIFRQGDPAEHIYVVLDGWVKIYRNTPSGEEAVLGVFGPGETFAEAAALLAGAYPANAEAAEPSRLCAIAQADLRDRVRKNPDVAFDMLAAQARHMHVLINDLEGLKTRNAEQRLGLFLLTMCEGRPSPCSLRLPYEKHLIAARLGMQPESLSRSFNKLATVGVRLDGNTVEITNVERLSGHCQQEPLRRRPKDDD